MRWVTYAAGDRAPRVGLVVEDAVHGLEPELTLLELLGDDGERLAMAGNRARTDPSEVRRLADVRLLSPLPRPPTIRDFYAFEQHVKTARQRRGLEMDADWYELPVFYFSNPYAVLGPDDDVPAAPGSAEMDYELEVAAVVGRAGQNLDPSDAATHIAGFCVMNDWSARDVQRREMKLSMGPVKGKDFATSLGPMLVTPDELESARSGHAYDLAMIARVNGTEYSRATLADIYWSFPEMLAYASRGTWVRPGDVIGSGTCGTGCILELSLVHGAERYPWLSTGDVVELEVERLGVLRNRVVDGAPLKPLRGGSS
ncbi:MAG: fumarylacetoacetate hydrolase family protein [Candidatus Dormibacteria bacterium]